MDAMQDNPNDAASVALSVVSITTGPNNRRSGRGSMAMSNPKKAYEEVNGIYLFLSQIISWQLRVCLSIYDLLLDTKR